MFACQSSARSVVRGASSVRALGLVSKPGPSAAAQVPVALRQRHSRREYHQGNGASRPSPARSRALLTKAASQPTRSYPLHSRKQQLAAYSTGAPAADQPVVHDVFETATGTWQYVVADPATSVAVIIDPVLDYDPVTQVITTTSADALLALVKEKGYKIDKILESHAHADHLTAASYLQSRLAREQGSRPAICIGKRIDVIQALFGKRYGVPASEVEGVFDKLFDDDEEFAVGTLKGTAIHLPGHTPDHLGYRIGDNVFCGDSLFTPDIGSARCDFPGGSASHLYGSGRRLLSLPEHVKIWTGHDYPPAERGDRPVSATSVQEHREGNKHLRDGVSEDEFVAMRTERDRGLGAPRLLHQSLQFNIRAGRLPGKNSEGLRLLHLPLRLGELEW